MVTATEIPAVLIKITPRDRFVRSSFSGTAMRAFTYSKYGPPTNLRLEDDLPRPSPEKNEALVRIKATAINDYDWSMLRGKPYPYRLLYGLLRPGYPIPGMELSGVVETVGEEVTAFRPGDTVYGDISEHGFGSFAEYVCVNSSALIPMPDSMNFAEAAALPHAAMLASQALIDCGNLQKNRQILINGAGGGVGPFALQIAKTFEATVTGVDTGEKLNMMKSIGFDHIIDYQSEDFTRGETKYDLILDCKTNRSPFAYAGVLRPGGRYVTVGGHLPRLLQLLAFKPLIQVVYKKKDEHCSSEAQ